MFSPSREQVRRFFCTAWQKYRERLPLDGAEIAAAEIIARHPEYHARLADIETAVHDDGTPPGGGTNPFLHLSLHLAIHEQVSIDQPPGIRAAFQQLCATRDAHAAEHILLEALGEIIWAAQRNGSPPDHQAYLETIRRLGHQNKQTF